MRGFWLTVASALINIIGMFILATIVMFYVDTIIFRTKTEMNKYYIYLFGWLLVYIGARLRKFRYNKHNRLIRCIIICTGIVIIIGSSNLPWFIQNKFITLVTMVY